MPSNKILLLLNDSDPILSRVSKLKIEKETGWPAIIPQNIEDAVFLFSKEMPEAVVTEIILNDPQGRSGFDFITELKTQFPKQHSRIIVLTTLSQSEDKERARTLGVDFYFVKSEISLANFIETLKKIL